MRLKLILDSGKGGFLFKVGNFRDLAMKILIYKKQKTKCEKMKRFALKRINRFNFEKNLLKYYKVLDNL